MTAEPAAGISHPFPDAPPEGAAVAIAPGILWMRIPLPMALDHVNVYALEDPDGWTIIDTGMNSRRTRSIWEALIAGPLAARPVRRVVATHHHPDHIGLAGWFRDRGAELLVTRTAWLYARMLTLDVQERPAAETLAFWRAAGMGRAMLERRAGERPWNFADAVAPLPLGYSRLAEGQTLRMGGRDWVVRTGDGHAPEHATFWSLDDPLVIGGDQLLPGISPNISVYATEPDADPLGEWLASCRRFRPLATEEHLVLPGHKLPFRGLPRRLAAMIDNHLAALDRLAAHLTTPANAAACFVPIFGREIEGDAYGLALGEAVAHLNHLRATGRASRAPDPEGVWLWQAATMSQSRVRPDAGA
jgi:glyoxylase-like metal-dependent hydrolase (beta-lactamase superfamily II)